MDKKELIVWKSGRIFVGIISILFSLLIISSANRTYIVSELMEENVELKETGIFTGFFMLLGGICGLCNCGNNSKFGFLLTTVFFAIPFFINDRQVFCLISMVFSLIFAFAGLVAKKRLNKKQSKYIPKPKAPFPKYNNKAE